MALFEPSLLPGLKDEVLLGGLKEMQTLETKTTWIVVHGPGMKYPLGPNLKKHIFTSNSADKRSPTDFLTMYDYMARAYVPKPADVHPKPHPKIGASQYHSMFDYMITKHRAEVKRRSRRVYEKPSVIYKRGLPVERDNMAEKSKRGEGHPHDFGDQNLGTENEELSNRTGRPVSNSQKVENSMENLQGQGFEDEKEEVSLRKSQVLPKKNEGGDVTKKYEGEEVSMEDSKVGMAKNEIGLQAALADSKGHSQPQEKFSITKNTF